MKLLLIIFLGCMALPLSIHAQRKHASAVVYRYHDSRYDDGSPSKCDCDYRLELITLYEDGTFSYLRQRGRLSPEQEFEKGTWTREQESLLTLTTTHRKGSQWGIDLNTSNKVEWIPYENSHFFTFHDHTIFNYDKEYQYYNTLK